MASQITLVELLLSLTRARTFTLTLTLTLILTLTLPLPLTPTPPQVELLLAEANAYTSALGVLSRFELRMQETHLVEASASKAAAQVHDEQG